MHERGVRFLLYASAIFLSAFLLFLIQPIAGKHLLPYFGGSSSVWATNMLFFTGVLFLGYWYAYLLSKQSSVRQARVHLLAIGAGTILVIWSLVSGSIFASFDWTVGSTLPPALLALLALASGIGVPYFLLATTGPLLQHWYGRDEEREPYKLYAISNAGSFLALACYPFLVEPYMRLMRQEMIWAILFCAYAALVAIVARRALKSTSPETEVVREEVQSRLHKLSWLCLAALPSLVLIAVTTQITQVIAPIPLLWIVPLSIYLATFILAFSGFRDSILLPIVLIATTIFAWVYVNPTFDSIWMHISANLAFLTALSLYCHVKLYRSRPPASSVTLFYLYVSLGGVVGTFLASIVAPVIFHDYWEFPLSLALAALLAISALAMRLHRRGFSVSALIFASLSSALVCIALVAHVSSHNANYSLVSRNFYGTAKVQETESFKSLVHGVTLHGLQFTDKNLEFLPAIYYAPESGVGRSIMFARSQYEDNRVKIAVVGLGIGTLAAYCVPGDSFVFYEIDPRIEGIARSMFTYLSRCPQAEVRYGDGRIVLEKEYREKGGNGYDVIIADAFNDDTVPVHLLTTEAIRRYVSHLSGGHGIVAVHISNRHLDLLPMLMQIAEEEALSLLFVENVPGSNAIAYPSSWVLLSPSPETFSAEIFENSAAPLSEKKVKAWTDDYSNIWSLIY